MAPPSAMKFFGFAILLLAVMHADASCYSWNQVSWQGTMPTAPVQTVCGQPDPCVACACFLWNGQNWQGTAPTSPFHTECGLTDCTPC